MAVGDAFSDFAEASLGKLRRIESCKDRVQVSPDHVFAGFDAYKQVIDCGVDVVILATPPHFRPQHLAYAVDIGLLVKGWYGKLLGIEGCCLGRSHIAVEALSPEAKQIRFGVEARP